jgi:hypothetical protein
MAKMREPVEIVRVGDPDWERLYKIWVADGKPGWVAMGNHHYQAIGFDKDVIFKYVHSVENYTGVSTRGTADMPKRRL